MDYKPNEIIELKKAFYKQKPIAKELISLSEGKVYSAILKIDGMEKTIYFSIPISECYFSGDQPAQLLIRWISLNKPK